MAGKVKLTKADRLCIRCKRSGFVLKVGIVKPSFQCEGCGATWCWGYDGGPYFENARNVGTTLPTDWIEPLDTKPAGRAALSQQTGSDNA